MRRVLWLTCALTLGLGGGVSAEEGASLAAVKARLRGPQARIVNGVLDADHPTVGALLLGANPDTAGMWCSGTLVGCKTFLTAGHCVEGMSPGDFTVFLPSAGFFAVADIDLHPSYDFPVTDIAVLELSAPVNGIAPSRLNTTASPPAGTAGTVVGFGRAGGDEYDYGLKRRGAVETHACPTSSFYSGSVCWRFLPPLGPAGSNSNTCNGDSGGPLFVDLGAGEVVAGVTSGGTSGDCRASDLSYDTDVFQQLAFVQSAGGADLAATACGPLPQVGEPLARVVTADGALGAGTPQVTHAFDVAPGTTTLRVALTGSEDGGSDFDLYLRQGAPPTAAVYDCRDLGPNQFGYCEIAAPAAGAWYAQAVRASGAGAYHATITTFGRDCALPANDGLDCNDGNDCTNGDVCSAGACAGAPVSDGSSCDDGNDCTAPDLCTAGACGGAAVADGSACDDGDRCSQPDVCQSGTCSGSAPALSCKAPVLAGRSYFQLKDRSPNGGDRLVWKWLRGAQTVKAEFGDPGGATDYALCVYDQSGGVPQRIMALAIPAGGRWTELTSGWRYKDARLEAGGVYSVLLKEGADGAARVLVKGKAHPLAMPDLGLQQDDAVQVQLLNDTSCWGASYGSSLRNDAEQFKARGE